MATCLRGPPMAHTAPCSSAPGSWPRQRRCSGVALANFSSSANIPMPPLNPKDPFLSKLAFVADNSPEMLQTSAVSTDLGTPPLLDLFSAPEMMARGGRRGRRNRPPDLPSIILNARIVYIGMPLVPEVSELIIAQLMYLSKRGKDKPIYLYIDSTGTTRDDGEIVALDSEGFAIYDALMMMENEIYTIGIGFAYGHACLLLAAGTKGKRYMFPSATAVIQPTKVVPSGMIQSSDIEIRAREAMVNRDMLVKLLAKHTGNPVEVVAEKMKGRFSMNAQQAIEFGVVDKIYSREDGLLMKKRRSRRKSGSKDSEAGSPSKSDPKVMSRGKWEL